jgi:hypothetical protein
MIRSITVTNHLSESITLELRSPEKSGLIVQNVDGLGPVKATINTTDISSSDGAVYNSARLGVRNIVLTLSLLETPSLEENRKTTYKYFPTRKKITVLLTSDKRVCLTTGYVESNEIDVFTNSQKAVVSIICPDPYFYSNDINLTIFTTSIPNFEFPFENEGMEANIEVGTAILSTRETVLYDGDSSIGVVIYMHCLGTVTNPTIYNVFTNESMTIDTVKLAALTGHGLMANDDVVISTVKGDKGIYLVRDGLRYNILNCLGRNINWFQLVRGDNVFSYSADSGLTSLQFLIENRVIYEGL